MSKRFVSLVGGAAHGARLVLVWGLALALPLGVSAAGCASSDSAANVAYSLTAKQNYDRGVEELADDNFPEAQRFFAFVKQKFPFSKYAVLAELRIADLQFARGNYQEAIDAYKAFIRLHPTHENVDDGYAAFKVAECYVKEMPEDWFLVPPAAEKDQSPVRDAYRELSDFVDKYPDSKYLDDAKKRRQEVMQRLVEHEVYVARFYMDTDHPKAAIGRLETAIRRYPNSGREGDLLLALGQTHLQMGNPAKAQQVFARVVNELGSPLQQQRAKLFLEYIRDRYGDTPKDKTPNG